MKEEITEQDILKDALQLFLTPLQQHYHVAQDVVAGLCVSTIYAGDIGKFETAVLDVNTAHPVERYDTEEEALAGHRRWRDQLPTLTTITKLGYGSVLTRKR